jgi:hypothetical protein
LPIRRLRLASTYDITIATVARRVKPNWTGNSGIPAPLPELEVDVLDEDEETEAELDAEVVVGVCDTTCTVPNMVGWIEQW